MLSRYYGAILALCTLIPVVYISFTLYPIHVVVASRYREEGNDTHLLHGNDTHSLHHPLKNHSHHHHSFQHADEKQDNSTTPGGISQVPLTGMTGTRDSSWPVNFWSYFDGRFYPEKNAIVSRNREFALTITRTGEIRIHRHQDKEKPKLIFWTNNDLQWVGEKWAEISRDGHFVSVHREKPTGGTVTVWSTGQWRNCKRKPPHGFVTVVMLTDMGALRMVHVKRHLLDDYNARGLLDEDTWKEDTDMSYTLCEPYAGDPDKIRTEGKEDMGRLAVVLTGSMRSYKKTCAAMNEKIFDKWPGSKGVDVFVATVDFDVWYQGSEQDDDRKKDEDKHKTQEEIEKEKERLRKQKEEREKAPVNWDSVRRDLRNCFGDRFKRLEIVTPLPHFPKIEDTGRCKSGGTPMDRLINIQMYVEKARVMVMEYMIRNGVQYDYVLRMRPDHMVWGDAIPPFEHLELDTIVYPMPYWEGLTWASTHLGTSTLTPSDQAAFGRFLPMSIYLSFFNSFPDLVYTSQLDPSKEELAAMKKPRKEVPPFFSAPCFEPTAPCPYDTKWPCLIEGYMSYWPTLHGLRIKLDWRWKVNLLRKSGNLAKGWGGPWNKTQGTRLVNNAFD